MFGGKSAPAGDDSRLRRAIRGKSWRDYMELTRRIAIEEAERGKIEITQKGEAVSPPSTFRGPIRLRLRRTATVNIGDGEIKVEGAASQPSSKRRKRNVSPN